jgi:DNA-binding XRE family transcriptional regulator
MIHYLYFYRIRNGLTQQALADRAGVSRRTVCRLEQSDSYPSLRVGIQISNALNCSLEEVFPFGLSL